jgi:hypothetical protein
MHDTKYSDGKRVYVTELRLNMWEWTKAPSPQIAELFDSVLLWFCISLSWDVTNHHGSLLEMLKHLVLGKIHGPFFLMKIA